MSPQTQQAPSQSLPPRRLLILMLALPLGGLALAFSFPSKHWGEPADGRARQVSHAGDWLAWSMLGMLTLMVGVAVLWALRLRRLSKDPDPALALLDELYQSELPRGSRFRPLTVEGSDDQMPMKPQSETSPDALPPFSKAPSSQDSSWQKSADW
ncbi:MAG: hypothetical protein JWP97_6842, partial [Labilithrix sp.]|nr:hypothetical protein [Labilithrix sp.]